MQRERFQRVAELFEAARDLRPEERSGFLDSSCDDVEVRREVESLLGHHEDEGDTLRTPIIDAIDPEALLAREPAPREQIGGYRIVGKIGVGGMGVVYLAEQDNPRRRVALKVIRPGVASRRLLQRFEHESQVLGRLQHPGIAQIFEAGTDDKGDGSQPFFAMEFIDGRPLLEFAEKRALGTRERLALMVQVCDAVHHAHQRGVIHRDLKPANILVDEKGQPKILDFGVARVTDGDVQVTTMQTDVGQLIGTLAYMSPEQVVADPAELDTRSDVYSLGVVLYQLLSGRLPYDLGTLPIPEAARVIRDDDPTRLSAVDRVFRGDLEAIVNKALEKDKSRRYQSASELAADIGRYLHDEPITARPATTLYQCRKLAARHKLPIAAAAVIMVLVATSAVVAIVQAGRNARERDRALAAEQRAQERFDQAWDLSRTLIFDLHGKIHMLPGSTEARRFLVQTALDHLGRLRAESADDPKLQHDLATAYLRIGEIQGAHGQANLGDVSGAEASFRFALELLEPLAAVQNDAALRYDIATANSGLGDTAYKRQQFDQAEAFYLEALAIDRAIADRDPSFLAARRGAAKQLSALARLEQERGHWEEAKRLNEEAIEILDALVEDDPSDLDARRSRAYARASLGKVYYDQAELDTALELYRSSIDTLEEALAQEPHHLGARRSITTTLLDIGDVHMSQENVEEALVSYRQSLDVRLEIANADPGNARAQRDVAVSQERLGDALAESGAIDEAFACHREAMRIRKALVRADPMDQRARRALAVALEKLGNMLSAHGDADGAIEQYDESRRMREVLSANNPQSAQLIRDLSVSFFKLGVAHADVGGDDTRSMPDRLEHWHAALGKFERSLEILEDMKARGIMLASDAHVPDLLQSNIDACLESIAALEADPAPAVASDGT